MKSSKLFSVVTTLALATGTGVSPSLAQSETDATSRQTIEGKILFEQDKFGGNGRTCLTCHTKTTGTISPEDAQLVYAQNPADPLFLHDGSDDGKGHGVTRMLSNATFLIEIPLPPNVSLASNPSARSVTVVRGTPTTLNTPSLDPVLMQDGREPSLQNQAADAIRAHYQASRQPTEQQLNSIAAFEKSLRFFSSPALAAYAHGGPAPQLPAGSTDSEKRGRLFFVDTPFDPNSKLGSCALCHSGPMLNATNQYAPFATPGTRFSNVGVSELNTAGNPLLDFVFTNPDGTTTIVTSPDPGRALITGSAVPTLDNLNAFKIPTLWGVSKTAPYFHDNSAKTLEDVANHYQTLFRLLSPPLELTEQDKADIVAYMKLLN